MRIVNQSWDQCKKQGVQDTVTNLLLPGREGPDEVSKVTLPDKGQIFKIVVKYASPRPTYTSSLLPGRNNPDEVLKVGTSASIPRT